ncbi:deoxynucleoside kinase [Mycoplasma miroungirhinis]|uniref:Deoxynucleoside kinase n=1 Tax=Mycoplasma miroungirhinis TaxID=754516 RepID=A0A6M4JCH4_9MOLU|nr:deoxynucleoside kinase [Mycoplasma miroungirhinis]QJR44045.1 deoxynucleoside kinase [Mycoplasma miroungirhinis]
MIIGISGMIASGKTSLSEKLHKHYKTSKMLHEFEEDDEVFNTFLKWLYEKKPNLTIGFQSYIVENHSAKFADILQEYKTQNLDITKDHIFLDRFSIEHYIFAKIILKDKPNKYLEAYDALFQKLITNEELPDLAIFLDINFETFKKRIFKRGRETEVDNWDKNVEYFKTLHKHYYEFFLELVTKFKLNHIVIDANDLNEKELSEKVIEIIDQQARQLNEE